MKKPRLHVLGHVLGPVLGLAAACGPAATTTTGTGAGTGAPPAGGGGAVELWAAVMKPGATFGFRDQIGAGDDAIPVDATVKDVTDVDGGKSATIEWSFDGEPDESSNLPKVIVVSATNVRFQGDLMGEPGELTWPASLPPFEEEKEGDWQIYIHDGALKGEVCYGEGPGKNAGDCEDVCFAELCVHPTHGLTGGSGKWWPNWSEYVRRDLSK
jgi:hypothetical protein